jgi:hypothetical protein
VLGGEVGPNKLGKDVTHLSPALVKFNLFNKRDDGELTNVERSKRCTAWSSIIVPTHTLHLNCKAVEQKSLEIKLASPLAEHPAVCLIREQLFLVQHH